MRLKRLLVFIAVAAGCSSAGLWLANLNANAQLAELRGLGVPASREEYASLFGASDPQAAELYAKIRLTTHTSRRNSSAALPLRKSVLSAQREYLANNSQTLTLLEQASHLGRPESFEGRSFEDYDVLVAPLRFKGFINAFDGDHNGALHALKTLDRITEQFVQIPGMASTQAQAWVYGLTPKILLREARNDPKALKAISDYLESRPTLRSPRRALLDDYIELDEGYSQARALGLAYSWRYMGPLGKAVRYANREILISIFRELRDDSFDWDRDKRLSAAALSIAGSASPFARTSALYHAYYIDATFSQVYKVEALRRMERLASLVLIERLKLGSIPKSMDFTGNVADPFTGKAFHYKKLTNGFMIYSCGPNKNDDGGLTKMGVSDDVVLGIQW